MNREQTATEPTEVEFIESAGKISTDDLAQPRETAQSTNAQQTETEAEKTAAATRSSILSDEKPEEQLGEKPEDKSEETTPGPRAPEAGSSTSRRTVSPRSTIWSITAPRGSDRLTSMMWTPYSLPPCGLVILQASRTVSESKIHCAEQFARRDIARIRLQRVLELDDGGIDVAFAQVLLRVLQEVFGIRLAASRR